MLSDLYPNVYRTIRDCRSPDNILRSVPAIAASVLKQIRGSARRRRRKLRSKVPKIL